MRKMYKILMLATLAVLAVDAWAAPVDAAVARAKAQTFLLTQTQGKLTALNTTLQLSYAAPSSVDTKASAYYVFNASDNSAFVIVAGEDRAEEILGYGDQAIDMDNLPCNMQWWLDQYKRQIEYLQAHPELPMAARGVARFNASDNQTVSPLVTCEWNQQGPYWNQCPKVGNSRCLTGCAATAMAQVMYYWKYPHKPTVEVPGYVTGSYELNLDALPSTTFDWDNMLDKYSGGYSNNESAAVAELMRYCGQACLMDYGPSGSGAYVEDQLAGMQLFGYNEEATILERDYYSADEWAALLKSELTQGRPLLYAGYGSAEGDGGHAFVVDGYKSNKYHINWGWGGSSDGYFAIDAFSSVVSGFSFNYYQMFLYEVYPGDMLEKHTPVMLPAEAIDSTSFTAMWIDETPAENVRDYTLNVISCNPYEVDSLLTETFAGVTVTKDSYSGISSFDNYCDNRGWTGSNVFLGVNGCLRLGSASATGTLVTPELNADPACAVMTVKFTARAHSGEDSRMAISCGDVTDTLAVTTDAQQYVILLEGVNMLEDNQIAFSSTGGSQRIYIDDINIMSGDATADAPEVQPTQYDPVNLIFEGITGKSFVVDGLAQGGSYIYHVVANYMDDTSSKSNVKLVKLAAQLPILTGDVNGDGEVNIADINAILDIIMGSNVDDKTCQRAELNGDNEITIADVNKVIDILLAAQ